MSTLNLVTCGEEEERDEAVRGVDETNDGKNRRKKDSDLKLEGI